MSRENQKKDSISESTETSNTSIKQNSVLF